MTNQTLTDALRANPKTMTKPQAIVYILEYALETLEWQYMYVHNMTMTPRSRKIQKLIKTAISKLKRMESKP